MSAPGRLGSCLLSPAGLRPSPWAPSPQGWCPGEGPAWSGANPRVPPSLEGVAGLQRQQLPGPPTGGSVSGRHSGLFPGRGWQGCRTVRVGPCFGMEPSRETSLAFCLRQGDNVASGGIETALRLVEGNRQDGPWGTRGDPEGAQEVEEGGCEPAPAGPGTATPSPGLHLSLWDLSGQPPSDPRKGGPHTLLTSAQRPPGPPAARRGFLDSAEQVLTHSGIELSPGPLVRQAHPRTGAGACTPSLPASFSLPRGLRLCMRLSLSLSSTAPPHPPSTRTSFAGAGRSSRTVQVPALAGPARQQGEEPRAGSADGGEGPAPGRG